jgi:hypothetical protein
MTDLSSGEWRTRFVELSNAVPAGISRVYLRFVMGPGHGGAAGNTNGAFRLDNVQLTGRPFEYEVTDGQIADSGYALRMQGNVYDASGIQADHLSWPPAPRRARAMPPRAPATGGARIPPSGGTSRPCRSRN